MADEKSKLVVQAHELRTSAAMAALLHGSRRSPRELRKPLGTLLFSLLLGVLLLAAVFAATRIGSVLGNHRSMPAHPAVVSVAERPLGTEGPLALREGCGV